jgi:hypothetical protein
VTRRRGGERREPSAQLAARSFARICSASAWPSSS